MSRFFHKHVYLFFTKKKSVESKLYELSHSQFLIKIYHNGNFKFGMIAFGFIYVSTFFLHLFFVTVQICKVLSKIYLKFKRI